MVYDAPSCPLTRRELLRRSGMGMGMLALAGLFADDGSLVSSAQAATGYANPLAPRAPHFPGTARRVIHLFMNGGPSHVDTFDPKPALTRHHGRNLPAPNLRTERKTGAASALSRFGTGLASPGIITTIWKKTTGAWPDNATARSGRC